MTPKIDETTSEERREEYKVIGDLKITTAAPRKYEIVWINVTMFTIYHLIALYGLYTIFMKAKWATILYGGLNYYLSVLGVGAGVHRLWSHKSYKATMPLQIFLMLAHSLANQHTIAHWVRDHRLHHKFSDTDADPHNATRGVFYSHIGWIMVKKHPEAKRRMGTIDMSDLYSNPVVMFQKRHQHWFIILMAFIIPSFIPLLWNESITTAFAVNMLRYTLSLNATFMVNSFAHIWGYKPYDKSIKPVENISVSLATFGEGYHNYHHAFPYDYRAGEIDLFFNYTTLFIETCAKLGLAYDLRYATPDVIEKRKARTAVCNEY